MKNRCHHAGPDRPVAFLPFLILVVAWCAASNLVAAGEPAGGGGAAASTATDPAVPSTATSEPSPVTDTAEDDIDWARHVVESYQEYATQQEETMAVVEQAREDAATAAAAATRSATVVEERLARIESVLASDRDRQVAALQQSQRFTLVMLGVFAVLGLGGMWILVLVLSRSMNRRVEVVASQLVSQGLVALPSNEPAQLTGPTPAELSSARFLEAVQRLEQRIAGMEQGNQPLIMEPPLGTGAGHGDPLDEPAGWSGDPAAEKGRDPVAREEVVDRSTACQAELTEADPHLTHAFAGGSSTETASVADLLAQGQSYLNLEQLDQAADYFRRVLALDPENAEAHVKLGSVLEGQDQIDEAMTYYNRAIDLDRTMTMAYLRKGGVFNRLERYGEALECYEAALRTQKAADLSRADG